MSEGLCVPSVSPSQVLKTTAAALVEVNISKNLVGSAMAGSIGGYNAHAANLVAAIYIACGQVRWLQTGLRGSGWSCRAKGSLLLCPGSSTVSGQQQLHHPDGGIRTSRRGPLHQLHHALHRAGHCGRGHQPAPSASLPAGTQSHTHTHKHTLLCVFFYGGGLCVQMLGVQGASQDCPGANAQQLARVVCATVLAGELSLMAALAAGHLVKSHMTHNR